MLRDLLAPIAGQEGERLTTSHSALRHGNRGNIITAAKRL